MHTLFWLAIGPVLLLMLLTLLSRAWKGARFYSRILSCYILMLGCAAYGVCASVVLRAFGKASIAQWTTGRAFRWVACPLMGLEFRVENEEILETRPAVFVSNHQSELDIVFLGRVFPKHCSVTAKRSLKYVPFLGWFMALSGTVFIDRSNRKSAIAAFDSAVKEIKRDRKSVWIFPEGTRSYYDKPDLLPFKKGAFHLAVQAGVPIVPVVVENYTHVLRVQERTFEPGVINVKVLDPIPTTGMDMSDVDALMLKTRDTMLVELKAISMRGVKAEKSQ